MGHNKTKPKPEPKTVVSFRFSLETKAELAELCERADGPPISQTWIVEDLIHKAVAKARRSRK